MDNASSKGHVGALIFIVGSLCVCGLALLIATPFALGSSIFMTEISPKFGENSIVLWLKSLPEFLVLFMDGLD